MFGKECAGIRRPRIPQPAPADDPADHPARTFGYARVSTDDQNLALQLDALRRTGCDEVFEDRISGKTTSRPALDRLLPQLRRGNTLAVWKLDRLGRGVLHLVALMEELRMQGVEFRSITEGMDTRTASSPSVCPPSPGLMHSGRRALAACSTTLV